MVHSAAALGTDREQWQFMSREKNGRRIGTAGNVFGRGGTATLERCAHRLQLPHAAVVLRGSLMPPMKGMPLAAKFQKATFSSPLPVPNRQLPALIV